MEFSGKIADRFDFESLQFVEVKLENGVSVQCKVFPDTDQPCTVLVSFGSGKNKEPMDKPGLATLAELVFLKGGLDFELENSLHAASKTMPLWMKAGYNTFTIGGRSTESKLPELSRLICAYLTTPAFKDSSLVYAETVKEQVLPYVDSSSQLAYWNQVVPQLHGLTNNKGLPTTEQLGARSISELKEWLEPQLTSLPINVIITGDFDLEKAIQQSSQTFGMMKVQRDDTASPYHIDKHQGDFPEGLEKRILLSSQGRDSYMFLHWPIYDLTDAKRFTELWLLRHILEIEWTKELEQELGEYSSLNMELNYLLNNKADAYLLVHARTFSGREGRFLKKFKTICYNTKKSDIDATVLESAKRNYLRTLDQNDTFIWQEGLKLDEARSTWLEAKRREEELVSSITSENLNQLIDEILLPETCASVVISPGLSLPKVLRPNIE